MGTSTTEVHGMDIRGFAAELRRRKVFRVAAFYAGGGFLVAQIADILLPGLALPSWSLRLVLALLILGFPLALALAWAFDVTPSGVVRTPAAEPLPVRGDGVGSTAAVVTPPLPSTTVYGPGHGRDDGGALRSIAVLPFLDLSPGRENEYFSDGLTEELLNSLARQGDLRVPARTSSFAFKGRDADVREIGRTLGVEAVLEGSVRKAGDRVRITAQLVDVSDGYHRWSQTYDRELADIFAIQEEIASSIVGSLGVKLSGPDTRPHAAPTTDVEAYDLCFRGLHDFHGFITGYSEARLRQALARFEEAIERDPECATAHAWHAVATVHLADDFRPPTEVYPIARRSAERALELDPALPEAHAVLGAVHLFQDWDPAAAETRLDRALVLNGNSSLARTYCSMACSARLRHEDAIRQARLALDVDPLSPLASWGLGWALHRARAHDATAAHARTRIEVDAGDAIAHLQLGLSRLAQGRPGDAVAVIARAVELAEEHPYYLAAYGHAAARAGSRTEALEVAARLEARFADSYVPPSEIAYPYIGLGDLDGAFRWLDRAVEARDSMLVFLDCEPVFDSLRATDPFQSLRTAVGLT